MYSYQIYTHDLPNLTPFLLVSSPFLVKSSMQIFKDRYITITVVTLYWYDKMSKRSIIIQIPLLYMAWCYVSWCKISYVVSYLQDLFRTFYHFIFIHNRPMHNSFKIRICYLNMIKTFNHFINFPFHIIRLYD